MNLSIKFYDKEKKCQCKNPVSVLVPDSDFYSEMEGYQGGVIIVNGQYFTACDVCRKRLGK